MTKFIVMAESSISSSPLERTATTAVEAEVRYHALVRICGRQATIHMLDTEGRPMSQERLVSLANVERAKLTS